MENLTITKEKVLEAASKCSQAKETLKGLFPECFEEDKSINLYVMNKNASIINGPFMDLIEVREIGEYKHKSFCLAYRYNWELKIDSDGYQCLIPTKK